METAAAFGQHAAMNSQALALALSASLLAAACGGSDNDDSPVLPDAAAGSDAAIDAPAQRTCSIGSDLGTPAGLTFVAEELNQNDPESPDATFVRILAVTDQGPPLDAINIQLWPGFGPYDPVIVTDPVTITGDETSFYTCGACALLIGDADPMTGASMQDFVASSGTMTITTVGATVGETVAGTLENAVFREVTFDDDNQAQTDVPNGCTVNLASVAFSATIQAPPMNRAGAPAVRRKQR